MNTNGSPNEPFVYKEAERCGKITDMVQIPTAGAFLDTQRIVSSIGVAPGQQVADLGCGSGFFTISLAQAVGEDGVVIAVDIMPEPLESVQTRAEGMGLKNVRAIRADLEVLGGTKIPDNSQDLSLLANTMFQSPKKEAMLAEAVRMLKPGGRLVIIEWKKGAKGFGPPDALRTDEDAMRALVTSAGVRFERAIETGTFTYGQAYLK